MIVLAVVAAAAAAPQDRPQVKILSQSFDQDDQGSYQYAYELDNGQKVGYVQCSHRHQELCHLSGLFSGERWYFSGISQTRSDLYQPVELKVKHYNTKSESPHYDI